MDDRIAANCGYKAFELLHNRKFKQCMISSPRGTETRCTRTYENSYITTSQTTDSEQAWGSCFHRPATQASNPSHKFPKRRLSLARIRPLNPIEWEFYTSSKQATRKLRVQFLIEAYKELRSPSSASVITQQWLEWSHCSLSQTACLARATTQNHNVCRHLFFKQV